MNKKSFLRGFGAGVLFVTVILGISCLIRTSDSAVITRAKKMGMTFASSSNNTIYDNTKTASGSSILGNEKNTKNNSDTESTPVPTSNAPDKKKKDKTRLSLNTDYKGAPWVTNTSRPNEISRGLQNRHIALWQSHGQYFKNENGEWSWQRPRLFCTTEDLFTQSFILPYVIPMLENAGANVFTPRERDTTK